MKILIVTPGFPPTKDGASEAASTMARGFLNFGWQVSVLTAATMPPREALSWQGADLAEFGYGGTYHQPTIIMQDPGHDFASFLEAAVGMP